MIDVKLADLRENGDEFVIGVQIFGESANWTELVERDYLGLICKQGQVRHRRQNDHKPQWIW